MFAVTALVIKNKSHTQKLEVMNSHYARETLVRVKLPNRKLTNIVLEYLNAQYKTSEPPDFKRFLVSALSYNSPKNLTSHGKVSICVELYFVLPLKKNCFMIRFHINKRCISSYSCV